MTAHKRPRDDGDESKTRTQLPSHKKRREYSEGDAQLARVYNDLADEIEDTRLKAASALIKHLSSDDSKNADAINAALTRLIKGVNSGRKAARLGFSVALPEVIRLASQTGVLSLLQLLDKIDKLTKVENSASGQEKRDALLGKQFALQALLQAAPSITAESSLWRLPFEHVSDLAKQRPWLRRQCGMSLYQFLDTEPSTEQVQALIDAWSKQTLWRTPEGVALWLKLADVDAVKLPKGIWSHQNPLSSKERLQLAKVMQEVPVDDDDTRTNSGTRQVTPSFAWPAVLDALSKHDKEKNLKEFWDTALTHGLFAGSSSNERKAFGLQIVTLAVSKLDPWALPYLLSKDIVQCIINHRSNTDRYLFEAAQRPLKAILSRCEADPATASGFLKPILQHGGTTFDQLTKTKTTEALLSHANGEALEEVADMVHNLILKPGVDEKKAEHQRRVLADLLVSALRAHRDESDLFGDGDVAPWVAKICHALIDAAYQHETAAEISSPAITSATRTAFQARLMSCIGHLLNYPLAQAVLLPTAVLSELRAGQVSAFANFRQKDKDALATAEKLLKGLGKKAKKLLGDNAADADGLKLLLSMSMLQVYNQEPDATSALQDLIMSLQSWVDDTSESKTIMTEIIISFTSKPSAAYKKLAEQVFTVLAPSMTSDSLQSLLDILQQNESASGQSELFARDDEQEDEDEDEGSEEDDAEDGYLDVEDDSDVEIANGLVTGGEDDSDDSDSASDVSMDDIVGDEEAEFDRKLKEALGTAAMDSDDDGSEMDDDQMLALEPHLATIFKERQKQTSAKQDNKDARENIIMFKNRILDLLNIYVKSQHSSAGAIEVIHPLIELIRTTTNKPTADKAFTVLKTFFDSYSKDKEASIKVEDEVLYALLGVLHAEVTEGGSKLHNIACSRSSLFVAKLLIASDINNYKQISKMYNELQVKWYLDPKSKIQGSMFTEWTSWSLSTRHGTKQPAE